MKRFLFLLFFIVAAASSYAQDGEVKKNLAGVQIGLFGLDLYDEIRMTNKAVLRAEASLFPSLWGGVLHPKTGYAIYPSVALMPKYYYNIQKRAEKGKATRNNAANYIGLMVRCIPDGFVISNTPNINVSNQIGVIPTFGIRRSLGRKINFESRIGVGYGTTFGYINNDASGIFDLSVKIGYDF